MSLGGNLYGLVVVDNFSRYTWTLFLHTKKEAYSELRSFPGNFRIHATAT